MKVLGIIPARGGSKGIPNKNLRELAGKPLLAYVAEAAREAKCVDRLILSTDSEAIAHLGRSLDIEVPFMRPAELASDQSPMLGVLQHAVRQVEEAGWYPEIIVLLQPTSPLRKPEHIYEAVERIKRGDGDSVSSVVPIPDLFAPQKALYQEEEYLKFWWDQGQRITRRQQLEPTYAREGTVYAVRRDVLMDKGTIYGDKCISLILKMSEAITLDTMDDWERAEAYFSSRRSGK